MIPTDEERRAAARLTLRRSVERALEEARKAGVSFDEAEQTVEDALGREAW